MNPGPAPPAPGPSDLEPDAVFAKIAGRYDRLNRVLSFGRDQAWRRSVAERLPPGRLLDLGSGTGAAHPLFGARPAAALDPSPRMLALNPMPMRVAGRGEALPFADRTFEAVFSAYVFRNLDSVGETLAEIARVLRPGGAAGVVDLARPRGKAVAALHRLGSAAVVPAAGFAIGAAAEYRYLHRSLDKLPPPEQLYSAASLRGAAPLRTEALWRMGPLGFVYGVILTRS